MEYVLPPERQSNYQIRKEIMEIEVGERLQVSEDKAKRYRGSVCYLNKITNRKYSIRKLPDGIYVWRLL